MRLDTLDWQNGTADALGGVYALARQGQLWAAYFNAERLGAAETEQGARQIAQDDYDECQRAMLSASRPRQWRATQGGNR